MPGAFLQTVNCKGMALPFTVNVHGEPFPYSWALSTNAPDGHKRMRYGIRTNNYQ